MKLGLCGLGLLFATVALGDAEPDLSRHREQSFTIHLNGSVADVTPLFGPVREREWSPEWKPEFVHPAHGGQMEGAIFTTTTNGQKRVWCLTTYDEKQGRIDYVVVTPDLTANQIKIRIEPVEPTKSQATITYHRTALTEHGVAEVQKLDHAWAEHQRVHSESAINQALAKGQGR